MPFAYLTPSAVTQQAVPPDAVKLTPEELICLVAGAASVFGQSDIAQDLSALVGRSCARAPNPRFIGARLDLCEVARILTLSGHGSLASSVLGVARKHGVRCPPAMIKIGEIGGCGIYATAQGIVISCIPENWPPGRALPGVFPYYFISWAQLGQSAAAAGASLTSVFPPILNDIKPGGRPSAQQKGKAVAQHLVQLHYRLISLGGAQQPGGAPSGAEIPATKVIHAELARILSVVGYLNRVPRCDIFHPQPELAAKGIRERFCWAIRIDVPDLPSPHVFRGNVTQDDFRKVLCTLYRSTSCHPGDLLY